MHHIYTTKAIIIKSANIGEANKYYFLLTHDLGFIKASAQGVRLEKSKLKGHLQDFSLVNISLVKGRNIWRITSVDTIEVGNFILNGNKFNSIRSIFSLIVRLVHGEEKNEALYDCVESFYLLLIKKDFQIETIKNAETITVLRILFRLGYFKQNFNLSDFVDDNSLENDVLIRFDNNRKIAIMDINEALKETHL